MDDDGGPPTQDRVTGQHGPRVTVLLQLQAHRVIGVARRGQHPQHQPSRADQLAVRERIPAVAVRRISGPDRRPGQFGETDRTRRVVVMPMRDQHQLHGAFAGQFAQMNFVVRARDRPPPRCRCRCRPRGRSWCPPTSSGRGSGPAGHSPRKSPHALVRGRGCPTTPDSVPAPTSAALPAQLEDPAVHPDLQRLPRLADHRRSHRSHVSRRAHRLLHRTRPLQIQQHGQRRRHHGQ